MLHVPILSSLILLPLLGSFFVLLMPEGDKDAHFRLRTVTLITSLFVFIAAIGLYIAFDPEIVGLQFTEKKTWFKTFNMSYQLGVDGLSLAMILLTAFVTPLAILSSWNVIQTRVKAYMLAFLSMESLVIGTFCAQDLLLFYVFFESVLIPMYFIIGIWGGERRIYASYKFFLYTLLGSILMLVAIVYIYTATDTTDLVALSQYHFSKDIQIWLWLAFFASFAVKIPMWPLHTWLPDAHVEAPTAGSVILASILLKMGGYGFIRFSLPLFPYASLYFADFVFTLSVIAVIYASLIALVQTDMKKLIAYSSIAHMGFVTLGIFTFNAQGMQGAIFQMLSHGFISAALFLCVGVLYDREHTRDIMAYGGLAKRMPLFATMLMIMTLASVGLPGTSGFVGEILVFLGSFQVAWYWTLLLGSGVILGAAYMLWLYRRVMLGEIVRPSLQAIMDLNKIEKACLIPLVIAAIFFGFYPTPLLKLTHTAAQHILEPFEDMPPIRPHTELGIRNS